MRDERLNILLETKIPFDSRRKKRWSAEIQSFYPDTSYPIEVYHPSTAWESIAAYGALLLRGGEEYWNTDKEVRFFANQCYRYRYNGHWGTLQEILERTLVFEDFEAVALELLGPCSYYGNLVPLIRRMALTVRRYDPSAQGRVRKKVRRRGYNDKGSLRPDFKRREIEGIPDSQDREDRRNKVAHPLLKEENFTSGVEDADEAHPLPNKWIQNPRKEEKIIC